MPVESQRRKRAGSSAHRGGPHAKAITTPNVMVALDARRARADASLSELTTYPGRIASATDSVASGNVSPSVTVSECWPTAVAPSHALTMNRSSRR